MFFFLALRVKCLKIWIACTTFSPSNGHETCNPQQHDAQMDYYGKRLATASSDRTVRIFDVVEGQYQLIATLPGYAWCLYSELLVSFLFKITCGQRCSDGMNCQARAWEIATLMTNMSWTESFAADDCTINHIPTQSNHASRHTGAVWQVCWAHPKFGNIIASCSYDKRIIIWKEEAARQWGVVWDSAQNNVHESSGMVRLRGDI